MSACAARAPAAPETQAAAVQAAEKKQNVQYFEGSIRGYKMADYTFAVQKGGAFDIRMETFYPAAYFLVYAPDSGETALFNSAVDGEHFKGTASASGAYRIRVYQFRATARRNETARYRLSVATGN
ncbi:MAG: hypothetical protein Q4A62_05655 [Eikenella sp.]|nr:hypothetical protein [Eikenella sp.]